MTIKSKKNIKSLIVRKLLLIMNQKLRYAEGFWPMIYCAQTVSIRGCNALDIERNETMLSPMDKGMCKL